ncbi:MAG: hypothetical protein ACXAC2_25755, partial [Candidatus Kariarchaeaceae archaeon]|jgi:hypothetical protein
MRRKKWYLPLYERKEIPFDSAKIIVNTKNMDAFTYSDASILSSGGGAGGQNFIYPKFDKDKKFYDFINDTLGLQDFVKLTNGILNSKLIQTYIKLGKYNQLSTSKIGELPIYKPSITDKSNLKKVQKILNSINLNIKLHRSFYSNISNFNSYIQSKFTTIQKLNFQDIIIKDFSEFIGELRKSKITLTISEEAEWLEYFSKQNQKILSIRSEIERTDREIDQKVYGLYDFSEEKIKII